MIFDQNYLLLIKIFINIFWLNMFYFWPKIFYFKTKIFTFDKILYFCSKLFRSSYTQRQFAVKDSNRNTPEFQNVSSYNFSVLETIGEVVASGEPISATDEDRCWYGNGRVTFKNTNGQEYFDVFGGDDIPDQGDESNTCGGSEIGGCTARVVK